MASNQVRRVAAGVAGVIALGVAALFTFGIVLIAPIGMTIAWWISRRRARQLSRSASWFAALSATAVVLVALVVVIWAQLPPGSWSKIQAAADSAKGQRSPPPAWLERIAPGSTARANAQQASVSPIAIAWFTVVGAMIGVGMLTGFVGTLGWLATLPLAFAISGHWIGSRPRDPPVVEEAAPA